ncbi:MAG: hypothetical protein ACXWM7_04750 [Parachlamydiaceae bacterium]
MKDAIHHLKHTQKKVIQSVRKAEQTESFSATPQNTWTKKTKSQLSKRPLSGRA